MLKKEFNKLWGTEFRVSELIEKIFQFFEYIDEGFESWNLMEQVNAENWSFWLENNEHYRYENNKVLRKENYHSMAVKNVVKLVGNFFTKNEFRKMQLNDFKNKILINLQNNNEIFKIIIKQLFDFYKYMDNSDSEIDYKLLNEIILAIDTSKNENILKLYLKYKDKENALIKDIAKESAEIVYSNIIAKLYNDSLIKASDLNYKKPPKDEKIIISIIEYLFSQESLEVKIPIYQLSKLFTEFFANKKFSNLFHEEINLKDFILGIETKRLNDLFDEYIDVNSRVLIPLGLLMNSDKFYSNDILKDFEYNNKNNVYLLLNPITESNQYPLTKEEVVNYLTKYNYHSIKNNLEEKFDKYTFVKTLRISTIIEYLVNLYQAYKFNIEPKNFKNFCNTILENKSLLPLIHAPGGRADMFYYNNFNLYCFETTIINDLYTFLKKEVFQALDHAIKHSDNIESKVENIKINIFMPEYEKSKTDFIEVIFDKLKVLWEEKYNRKIEIRLVNISQIDLIE